MPKFTVESTYHLPVYRHRTYDTATPADACRKAIGDDDWSTEKCDCETAGETYITGIWSGTDTAYRIESTTVPSQFRETIQRKAEHFQELFDQLVYVAQPAGLSRADFDRWLPKAIATVERARAIIEERGDPRCADRAARVMISTNAGPESLRSKPFVSSATKRFWQPTFPTLPTWQNGFVATSTDTFWRQPRRSLYSPFRLDLSALRFGMVCIGNGIRTTVFRW